MIVKCVDILFGYNDFMTIGKKYEVYDIEYGEYWIDDDRGEHNPFPQECFEEIF